ncbi:MAG: hypothetical protein MJ232_04935 [archaeon]|nr:hypothetical protein [archaeon]
MAKSKKFRRIASRASRNVKSFSRGLSRTSVTSNVKYITRNALKLSRTSTKRSKYTKARFKAKQVNDRLSQLKRWGHYDTWSSKQLIARLEQNKLNILNEEGLIDVSKINIDKMNMTALTNMNKAIDTFLNSKTKTIQGINATINKKRSNLVKKSNNPQWVKTLTNKEVETLYRIYDDEEFKNLSEKIKYETIWNKVITAKQTNTNKEDFIEDLQAYLDPRHMNDADVLEQMNTIYDKYVQALENN